MGVIDLPMRLKACNRQKMLWDLHCKQLCSDRKTTTNEPCNGCRIYEELKQLGQVFNSTLSKRVPANDDFYI